MHRPVILITCDLRESKVAPTETMLQLRLNYAQAVLEAGGLPLMLPPLDAALDAALDLCDGVVLSGADPGSDVPRPRAAFEQTLIAGILARRLPVLGICHGMQALGVALGGQLVQDDARLQGAGAIHHPAPIPDRFAHPLQLVAGSRFAALPWDRQAQVNSLHRHALGGGGQFRISAIAPDGVIEAIESDSTPFCLAVQWHPEYMLADADRHLFQAFVAAAAGRYSPSILKGTA